MFVYTHMLSLSQVITVQPESNLEHALDLMKEYGHDALPVVAEGVVVGLISKQHIYKTYFFSSAESRTDFARQTSVQELMKTDFRTILENELLEKAILILTEIKMQFLTVVNSDGRLVGLLTKRKVLNAFADSLGLGKKGLRIELAIDDLEGRLAALSKTIYSLKLNISSLTMTDSIVPNYKKILMHIDTEDQDKVIETIEDAGFRVLNAFLE